MIDQIVQVIETSGNLGNPEAVRQALSSSLGFLDCSILKQPRDWKGDSFIIKAKTPNTMLCIKVYPNWYPTADHMYRQSEMLHTLWEKGLCPKIHHAADFVTFGGNAYKIVVYDFIDGTALDDIVPEATPETIREIQTLLKEHVSQLLKCGAHPWVKDLGDFLLVKGELRQSIVMTDINALSDIQGSLSEVRDGLFRNIVTDLIDKLVTPDYQKFQNVRPAVHAITTSN